MSEVKIKAGESVDRAVKRLNKQMGREGTMDELRKRRYFEKPSVKNKIRKQNHKFQAKVQARNDRLERKRV